jgi:hypothetical protein
VDVPINVNVNGKAHVVSMVPLLAPNITVSRSHKKQLNRAVTSLLASMVLKRSISKKCKVAVPVFSSFFKDVEGNFGVMDKVDDNAQIQSASLRITLQSLKCFVRRNMSMNKVSNVFLQHSTFPC